MLETTTSLCKKHDAINFRGDDEAFGLSLPGVLLETSNVTDKTSVRKTFTTPPLTAIMMIYI